MTSNESGLVDLIRHRSWTCASSHSTSPQEQHDWDAAQHAIIGVSVVSDSPLLREGIDLLLTTRLSLYVIGSYPIEPLVYDALPNPANHIVLLDGSTYHDSVVHWASYWRGLPTPPCIVVIELPDNIDVIARCIESGATGIVLRSEPFQRLAATIEASRKGAYCSPEVTAQLFTRLASLNTKRPRPEPPPLTAREREVLQCIVHHCSNQAIAEQLVIEVRTVKHHVHNILEKLKLRYRWEAAQLAVERRWFSEEPIPKDTLQNT